MGGVPETPKDRREITPAGANADTWFATVFVLSSRAEVRGVVFSAVGRFHRAPMFSMGNASVAVRLPECFAAVVQQQNASLPRRRSGCDSRRPHQFTWQQRTAVARQERRWRPNPVHAGAIPARRAAKFSSWDRGSTRKAPALQAGSCGSKNPPVPPFQKMRRGRRGRLGGLMRAYLMIPSAFSSAPAGARPKGCFPRGSRPGLSSAAPAGAKCLP